MKYSFNYDNCMYCQSPLVIRNGIWKDCHNHKEFVAFYLWKKDDWKLVTVANNKDEKERTVSFSWGNSSTPSKCELWLPKINYMINVSNDFIFNNLPKEIIRYGQRYLDLIIFS